MRIVAGLVAVICRWVLEMCDEDDDILGLFREKMRGWQGYVAGGGIVLSRRYMLRQRITGFVEEGMKETVLYSHATFKVE